MSIRTPNNEQERLKFVRELRLLDTEPEPVFNELAQLAANVCATPAAMISLVDQHRVFLKARHGVSVSEIDRETAFCSEAICTPDRLFEISDASVIEPFSQSRLVVEPPHVRFYAGFPIVTQDGFAIGTLCVASSEPKCLLAWQKDALRVLAHQVANQIDLRLVLRKHIEYENALERYRQELEETVKKLM